MVTLKELEKQRIEKIKSLDSSQLKNYVKVLIKDICKLHEFNSVTNPDERLKELESLYVKLKEIKDLTGDNFNNINNYINITLNADLTIALTVEIQRYILKDAKSKNYMLHQLLGRLFSYIHDFRYYSELLYDIISDINEVSAVAPNVAESMKEKYVEDFKIMVLMAKDEIETNAALIDVAFYSDETIKNDIHELKVTIKNFADSDDAADKLFVELGLLPILADLVKAYENHAEIKKLYTDSKLQISELFESADNIFKEYSVEKYDADSDVSFKKFMKGEPTFNINTGELVLP